MSNGGDPVSKSTTAMVLEWKERTTRAALLFEQRWTYAALRRVSRDVASRLHGQRNLFAEACIKGASRDVVDHGSALIRGYQVAVKTLEEAGEADDAYMLGVDLVTGLKVAIGQQRGAIVRIRQVHGQDVIWLTPDEVARIMSGLESFKTVEAVKRRFPGAEILDRYEDEGNRESIDDNSEGPSDAE